MNSTTETSTTNIDEITQLGNERDEYLLKRKQLMTDYLDDVGDKSNKILVTKGAMGNTEFWLGHASLRWIHQNIKLFTQLPLFRDMIDPETGKFVVDEMNIEALRQRAPNWSRQHVLTQYLLRHKTRLFPPMIVVTEEPWVNKLDADEWQPDEHGVPRATRTSLPVEHLDSKSRIGTIDISETDTYVIDGSHRWVGIAGVMELFDTSQLTHKKKSGAVYPNRYDDMDTILEELGVTTSELVGLENEQLGIQFIPAVMKGESPDDARIRVRSVFVHINKAAQPPTKGEEVLLDEDDGFSILTREVALSHPLFKNKRLGDRVNWKSSALPSGSVWLTTGKTLRDLAEVYLGASLPYADWKTKSKEIAVRPKDSQLKSGIVALNEFLNHLVELPSFGSILRGDPVDDWREFHDKGRGHLLMRPIGQLILAEAVGYLHVDANGPQLTLGEIFEKLGRYDENEGFETDESDKHWYRLTYDPDRQTMVMQNRQTAVKLLIHLIGGLDTNERDELKVEFQKLRSVDGGLNYNHDGTEVPTAADIQLPPMI